ncbi:hypothetical protein Pan44_43960 [Caulifigura coniformis]|uniref:DUF455 domain-containing protein n=1 Tax=Caulifigura coniformis TaxID=2527983 RepID=A0A517SJN9_9PLAN|nr:ferritin-like domain-containing protein [Caulifigura coniformis]QDT56343.1 hypothetical protein Pan44_43960 [Caulifigura coniformis]
MEIRDFARRCLLSSTIEEKLLDAELPFTDPSPGPAERVAAPARPADLEFADRRTAPKLPSAQSLKEQGKRGLAHHILANHELQALEVMAWTLLAFPDAPPDFRLGVANVMRDEQRHTRMHIERAARLGVRFGEFPVNGYIWQKSMSVTSVLDYCACLPLVFEGRNLDHSLELAEQFAAAGDERSAALMRTIHRDEIQHVAFGLEWLRRLKPAEMSDWEAFETHLHWPLRAEKASGDVFQREAREAAGMSTEFIAGLLASRDEA